MPIYDLQTDIPWFYDSHMPFTERLNRVLETNPEMIEMLLSPEPPPPYPGAKDILRWETHMVRQHPLRPYQLATAPRQLPLNTGAATLPQFLWHLWGSAAMWCVSIVARVDARSWNASSQGRSA